MFNRRYDKAFIMLKQEVSGFSMGERPVWGSCAIEIKNGKGRFTIYVQGLKQFTDNRQYMLYAIAAKAGGSTGIGLCPLEVDKTGKAEAKQDFDPENLEGTGLAIEAINVIAIMIKSTSNQNMGIIAPLAGYRDNKINWKNNFSEFQKRKIRSIERTAASAQNFQKTAQTHKQIENSIYKKENEKEITAANGRKKESGWKEIEGKNSREQENNWKEMEGKSSGERENNWKEMEAKNSREQENNWKEIEEKNSREQENNWKEMEGKNSRERENNWKEIEEKNSRERENNWKEMEGKNSGERENNWKEMEGKNSREQENNWKEIKEKSSQTQTADGIDLTKAVTTSGGIDFDTAAAINNSADHTKAMTAQNIEQKQDTTYIDRQETETSKNGQTVFFGVETMADKLKKAAQNIFGTKIEQSSTSDYNSITEVYAAEKMTEVQAEQPEQAEQLQKEISESSTVSDFATAEDFYNDYTVTTQEKKGVGSAENTFLSISRKFKKELEELEKTGVLSKEEIKDIAGRQAPKKENPDLDYVFRHNSRVTPFQGNKDCLWRSIGIEELVLLPCDSCRFMKQVFLVSSYRKYKHLLLGKSMDGLYYLGVPDKYSPSYNLNAERIGFSEFKTCTGEKPQEGSYGYWIRPMKRGM